MKWVNRLAALMFGLISFGIFRDFFSKYEVILLDKDEIEKEDGNKEKLLVLHPENYDNAMDMRGTPTHVCPCGCNIWNVKVSFDNFEIAQYFLDMECASCGSLATAPTPNDRKEMEQ